MRQGSNVKRSRNRGARRSHNPRSHTLDSNGPSVRIRGNAIQIYEKYQQLARDASASGDRVVAENLLQHAEHYYRLANSAGMAGANGTDRRAPRGNGQAHPDDEAAANGAAAQDRNGSSEEAPKQALEDQSETEPQPA